MPFTIHMFAGLLWYTMLYTLLVVYICVCCLQYLLMFTVSPPGCRYRYGMRGRMRTAIIALLNEYYRVEEIFQGTVIAMCWHGDLSCYGDCVQVGTTRG